MARQTKAQLEIEITKLAEELEVDNFCDRLEWYLEAIPKELSKRIDKDHHLNVFIESCFFDVAPVPFACLSPDMIKALEKGASVDLDDPFDDHEFNDGKDVLSVFEDAVKIIRAILKTPRLVFNCDHGSGAAYIKKPVRVSHLIRIRDQLLKDKEVEDKEVAKRETEKQKQLKQKAVRDQEVRILKHCKKRFGGYDAAEKALTFEEKWDK